MLLALNEVERRRLLLVVSADLHQMQAPEDLTTNAAFDALSA
jgi:hypothetical protein